MFQKVLKTINFPLVFLKTLVVTFAIWTIFHKVFYTGQDNAKIWGNLVLEQHIPFFAWCFLLLFSAGNWFFEIKKWQSLAAVVKPISFAEARKQSLSSLTASIFTPNRIGEYGAKSLFYFKNDWKKVVFLNFAGNMAQLCVTIILGITGILFLLKSIEFPFSEVKIGIGISVLLLLLVSFLILKNKNWEVNRFSFPKLKKFSQKIPVKVKKKVFFYSFIRYFLFSHQFYLFLMLFGVEIGYFQAISAIFVMYLFASALPSVFILEVVVKGSVALWVFSSLKIDEAVILSTVGFMWIFNFALPALLGSYYVLKFKPVKPAVA